MISFINKCIKSHDLKQIITEASNIIFESVYYHGSATPKKGDEFTEFKKSTGKRFNMMGDYDVQSDWMFFTKDIDYASSFARRKSQRLESKYNFPSPVLYTVDINELDFNVLDLTTDDYEFKLEKISE